MSQVEDGDRLSGRAPSFNLLGLILSSSALIAIIAGGIYWLIGLETKNAFVARDLASFRDNVMSLNTPLSQRVFSLEARVAEIARIQGDVRATMSSIDANGTSQNKVLRRDIDAMRVEISGQNTRCSVLNEAVSKMQNDLIETRIRLQYLIEAVMPHIQGPQKKSLFRLLPLPPRKPDQAMHGSQDAAGSMPLTVQNPR